MAELLTLLLLAGTGLALGRLSYRMRLGPLMRSLQRHISGKRANHKLTGPIREGDDDE